MPGYTVDQAKIVSRLREQYGEEVILSENGKDEPVTYRIALEFDVQDKSYVLLQAEGNADKDREPLVFRVVPQADGEYDIETIEDDDEWEDVSELADELTTSFEE